MVQALIEVSDILQLEDLFAEGAVIVRLRPHHDAIHVKVMSNVAG